MLLLSSVVQSAGDACLICSAQGLIQYANPAFTAATGYDLDEVKGKSPSILKSGLHVPAFYEGLWQTILAGKVFRGEFINKKKNGEIFYEDKTISPVFGERGEITHYISVGRDISQQKRVNDELRISERRYRNLIANASDMIFTHDGEGRLLSLNGAGETSLSLSGREWWKANAYEILGEGYRSEVEPLVRGEGNGARSKRIAAVETKLPDGRTIVIEPTVRVTKDDGGEVHVEVIARDITERLRLQAQLQQSQKMETLGRLAGGVAHDFNNLLTVILGFGQLARDQVAQNPDAAQMIGEVVRAGERGAALARQLLAFTRQQVLHPRLVDIHGLLHEMMPMLRRLIGEQVQIELDLVAVEAVLLVDPGQFEQVIVNLAVNARDAMPHGGRITVSTSTQPAETGGLARLQVRVSDSGMGMDEQTLSRIFDPFFTTKATGHGTGLGLSIVKGIVEQSGGTIQAESVPGQGTCFVIQIPSAAGRPESLHQHHLVEAGAPSAAGGRILLAEDEPEVRRYFERILEDAGYEVVGATDGQEALALISQKPRFFDLLISDVVMPGVSGAELARRLLKLNPTLKVLFLTGYAEHSDLRWLQESGFEIEAKPITRSLLLERVAAKLNAKDKTAAVLVVDDDPAIRRLLRGAFEREGHTVMEAGEGGEALSLLEAQQVDAVVTDLSMPGMEGIETIREMRRRRPELVIVVLSGQSASLRAASLLGADAALSKPGDTLLAVATVQRLLRRNNAGSGR
ncbi:MAG: response regulator [Acidobacteria bacterium]|nr:response regulator [Acidobacteriota bacterium]